MTDIEFSQRSAREDSLLRPPAGGYSPLMGDAGTHFRTAWRDANIEGGKVILSPMLSVDAESEKFIGEHSEAANRFLKREYRAPYVVPQIGS